MTGTFRNRPSASQVKSSKAFQAATRRAESLVKDPAQLGNLIQEAKNKAAGKGGALDGLWDSLSASFRLIKAWGSGRYRQIPTQTLLGLVAALLYFVMPADLIPDFILGLGLVDDAAILAWTLNRLSGEIDQFKRWEGSSGQAEGPPSKAKQP